jgi:ATP-dependent DNA helicase RecG
MLTDLELKTLLATHENERVEFTVSTTDTDKFCQAVCAFANDITGSRLPGYLLIGVNDNAEIAGLKVTDELMRNLSGIRSDGNVLPQPALTIQKLVLAEGEVVVLEVQPSDFTPVRYKGKIWIRIGPRKAIANESEERILIEKRTSSASTFDALPCLEATIDDLRLDLFKNYYLPKAIDEEVLKADTRTVQLQLASLRFFDLRYNCPTFAAIILFGKNPEYFLAGAYTQYVKFAGDNVASEILSQYKYTGNLCETLPKLDAFIETSIVATRPIPVSVLREENVRNYPYWAIRELLMNAVMHRDYQTNSPAKFYEYHSKIEISNPGNLYGQARPENFPSVSDYRNPIISEGMKILGFVNKFSRGVMRVREELKENKNGEPVFNFNLLTALSVQVGISESANDKGFGIDEINTTVGTNKGTNKGTKIELQEVDIQYDIKIIELCISPHKISDLMLLFGFSDRTKFKENYIDKLLQSGLLEMSYPEIPTHKKQKYQTTNKGKRHLKNLK